METDNLSLQTLNARAARFLNLAWVHGMHSYVRTIEGLNPPAPPPDRPGMATTNRHGTPILTLPGLMARAKSNAASWESLLGEMLDTARPIKEYATAALVTVEVIDKRAKKELAPAAWAALTPEERKELQDEFAAMVDDLIAAASDNEVAATRMRDRILDYRKDIVADHDESQDIQAKYKDWIAEEDKTLAIWEREHGLQPAETETLIAKLQEDVQNLNAKWAGMTSGAAGLAGGTVGFGLVVFPPLSAIAGLIGMSVMAAQAAQFKRQLDDFRGRLDRVQKYNVVAIFFRTVDSMLRKIIEAIENAAEALGQVAGLWAMVVQDLKSVQGSTLGVAGLAGDKRWEAPVRLTRRLGVERAYDNLIRDCDVFVQYAYVQNIATVDAGK